MLLDAGGGGGRGFLEGRAGAGFCGRGELPSQERRRGPEGPGRVPGGWCVYIRVRRSGARVLW